MSKDLLKEAIADAKAVRETAIANAKLALEEAFTPKLQSMLSAKLQEDDMEDDEDLEDGHHEAMRGDTEEGGHEPEEGAHEEGMHDEDETEEGMREEDEDEAEEGMREEDMDDDKEEGMREEDMDDEEDDLDLESIIKELEGDDEDEAEEGMREASDSTDIGKGDNKMDQVSGKDQDDPGKGKLKEEEEDETEEGMREDLNLDEIIASLTEEDEDDKEEGMHEELAEAYKTIESLKDTLQEVNLLNAKLLFSNKLFKVNNLSESQKMKVIETFDRASNLREVKLVYTTLAESFTGKTVSKKGLTEGLASKKSNSTAPKGQIVESNGMADRMKRLAGLL
tara:strand:+ start:11053 stop:12066 length:1014 start_codon:yes stop_codon:yes gene_type:complete